MVKKVNSNTHGKITNTHGKTCAQDIPVIMVKNRTRNNKHDKTHTQNIMVKIKITCFIFTMIYISLPYVNITCCFLIFLPSIREPLRVPT